jgi:hypothetical protein
MAIHSTQVSVVGHMSDMIFIDIHNQTLQYESFEFNIYNGDKKVVRKGYFRAPSVQLRTNNLAEGTYQFELLLNGKVWETTEFRKKTDFIPFA